MTDMNLRMLISARDTASTVINSEFNPALNKAAIGALKAGEAALKMAAANEKLNQASLQTAAGVEKLRVAAAQADMSEAKLARASIQTATEMERLNLAALKTAEMQGRLAQSALKTTESQARLAQSDIDVTAALRQVGEAALQVAESAFRLLSAGALRVAEGFMSMVSSGVSLAIDGFQRLWQAATRSSDGLERVKVQSVETSGAVRDMGASTEEARGHFSGLKATLEGFGSMAAFIGVIDLIKMLPLAVQKAADYQQSLLKVQALTGLTQQQTMQMSTSILRMATDVGKSPKELADGLYYVASAGFRGADALNILRLSAEASATGGMSTKVAADALTSALNAFQLPAKDANKIMDQMTATVSAGKMEWGNYANVVGKLSVIAKASGVSFVEANAALATLTNSGYSARLAGTSLSNLFTQLDLKTDSMAKNARKLGVSFDEQRFKSMNLAQQIDYLNKVTGGNQSELLKMLNGNVTALKTFDALSGSMRQYKGNLASIGNSQGMTAAAFAITQQGFNQSVNRLKASFDVLLISVGTLFLPVLTKLIVAIAPVVAGLANWVAGSQTLFLMLNDKVSPSISRVSAAAYWLALYFGRDLHDATQRLYDKMYILANQILQNGGVIDAFTQSSAWILNTGTPVYTSFSHVVGDVLGGSYQKLGHDALTALHSIYLAEVQLGLLEIKLGIKGLDGLKNVKPPEIKMPSLGGMPGGDMFAQFAGPLKQVMQVFQGIGKFFQGLFQPFIDEWNRVSTALEPSIMQFAQWWQNTMGPLFGQMGDKAKGAKSPLKDLLDIFGNAWIVGSKVFMILVEFLLPALVKWWGLLWTVAGPILGFILQGFLAWTNWLSTDGIDTFRSFFDGVSGFITNIVTLLGHIKDAASTALGWVGDHIGPEVQKWQGFLSGFGTFLSGIWSGVSGGITGVLNGIIGQVDTIISAIDKISVDTPLGHVGFSIPLIPLIMNGSASTGVGAQLKSFASGVENFSGGLAYVHKDELLVNMPAGTSVKKAGSFGGGHTINVGGVTVNATPGQNPQQIAQAVIEAMSDGVRFQGVIQNFNAGGSY